LKTVLFTVNSTDTYAVRSKHIICKIIILHISHAQCSSLPLTCQIKPSVCRDSYWQGIPWYEQKQSLYHWFKYTRKKSHPTSMTWAL